MCRRRVAPITPEIILFEAKSHLIRIRFGFRNFVLFFVQLAIIIHIRRASDWLERDDERKNKQITMVIRFDRVSDDDDYLLSVKHIHTTAGDEQLLLLLLFQCVLFASDDNPVTETASVTTVTGAFFSCFCFFRYS